MAKGKFAIGALIGVAAGFVAGILTAPKSGKETRDELKTKATQKKEEVVAKGKEVRSKAGDVAEDVVSNAEKAAGKAADAVVSATEKASKSVVMTTKDLKARSKGVAKTAKTAIKNNK